MWADDTEYKAKHKTETGIDTFKEPLQENHRGNVKAPGFVGVLHDEVNLKLIMSPVGLLTDTT